VTIGQYYHKVPEGIAVVLVTFHVDTFSLQRLKKRQKSLKMLYGRNGHTCAAKRIVFIRRASIFKETMSPPVTDKRCWT
jgi:hypothetical protein